jgi:O-antigen ligase
VLRSARALALVVVALVPLAAWPATGGDPFVAPRLAVLAVGTILVAAGLLAARRPLPAPAGTGWVVAWLAALGLSAAFGPIVSLAALLEELLVVSWAFVLAWASPAPRRIAFALQAAAVAVAAIAVLQWAGMDPWALAGWVPAREYGPRMRVFATLGNPNYVGAFLAALLPVIVVAALGPERRWTSMAPLAVTIAGIAATGSRGAWLGAAAGAAWLAIGGAIRDRARLAALVAVVAVVGTAVVLGPARGLGETVRGRTYIWSVTAPHLLAHPLTGWGPGSFQVTYPGWEAERIERSVDADVRAYATAQRHAHNDYVERLSDLGVPGLAAWVALVGWVLLAGGRQTDRMPMAAAAGIAALAAVSLVDFPMQRPVERFTWWTLAVLATRAGADRLESRETGQ